MQSTPEIYLVDNGSLRPQATLALRQLARAVTERSGLLVQPVSLLHSHKVDASELGGVPSTIVKRRMREALKEGKRSFVILPLFFGPSRAITDYLPQVVAELQQESGEFDVRIAKTLCGDSFSEPDPRLANMLADQVRHALQQIQSERPLIALTDHGTPAVEVNQLRNAVAAQLKVNLGAEVADVVASSMERREGSEYDFNEPLLERLTPPEGCEARDLIVAMFFLLPGRHAGDGGDVDEICSGLIERGDFQRVRMAALLGEHPDLVDILSDRLSEVLGRD